MKPTNETATRRASDYLAEYGAESERALTIAWEYVDRAGEATDYVALRALRTAHVKLTAVLETIASLATVRGMSDD